MGDLYSAESSLMSMTARGILGERGLNDYEISDRLCEIGGQCGISMKAPGAYRPPLKPQMLRNTYLDALVALS